MEIPTDLYNEVGAALDIFTLLRCAALDFWLRRQILPTIIFYCRIYLASKKPHPICVGTCKTLFLEAKSKAVNSQLIEHIDRYLPITQRLTSLSFGDDGWFGKAINDPYVASISLLTGLKHLEYRFLSISADGAPAAAYLASIPNYEPLWVEIHVLCTLLTNLESLVMIDNYKLDAAPIPMYLTKLTRLVMCSSYDVSPACIDSMASRLTNLKTFALRSALLPFPIRPI